MTGMYPRYPRVITDEEAMWLETTRVEPVRNTHICGNCRTPWGRSALPCRNDPATQAA